MPKPFHTNMRLNAGACENHIHLNAHSNIFVCDLISRLQKCFELSAQMSVALRRNIFLLARNFTLASALTDFYYINLISVCLFAGFAVRSIPSLPIYASRMDP